MQLPMRVSTHPAFIGSSAGFHEGMLGTPLTTVLPRSSLRERSGRAGGVGGCALRGAEENYLLSWAFLNWATISCWRLGGTGS